MADDVIAPIPLPDLTCASVQAVPGGFCITFPGGTQLCAQAGLRFGDTAQITESLFASINSALMPLQPFFIVIDVFQAVFNCITAVPKILGPPPSPAPVIQCIQDLSKALQKLLALLPALSIPRLVKGILQALVLALSGFKNELQMLIAQQQRIIEASTLAAEPGNFALQAVVDCASGNFDVQLQNLNEALAPLNRLLGVINVLLQLAGQSPLPDLGHLGNDAQSALGVLDDAIKAMQIAAAAIPVPA